MKSTRKISQSPAKWLLICSALLSLLTSTAQAKLWLKQDESAAQENGGYATRIEQEMDYINAFLAGFKSPQVIPSATNCTKYLQESVLIYNDTQIQW